MPHIQIEYNSAVEKHLSIQALAEKLHAVAMTLEALPTGGIRTRAYSADVASVGDGARENGFIYVIIRLGQGRTSDVKRQIGKTIFGALTEFTTESFEAGSPLSLGLEIQEIERNSTWKKNNIHQIIKDKNNG